jgi:hypothetical protein
MLSSPGIGWAQTVCKSASKVGYAARPLSPASHLRVTIAGLGRVTLKGPGAWRWRKAASSAVNLPRGRSLPVTIGLMVAISGLAARSAVRIMGKRSKSGPASATAFGGALQRFVPDLSAELAVAVDLEPDLALQLERARDCLIFNAV